MGIPIGNGPRPDSAQEAKGHPRPPMNSEGSQVVARHVEKPAGQPVAERIGRKVWTMCVAVKGKSQGLRMSDFVSPLYKTPTGCRLSGDMVGTRLGG